MISHWSLRDNTSPQVSKTLLSILADLNNSVVWIVSTRLLISKSPSFCTDPFGDCTKSTDYNLYHRHLHMRTWTSLVFIILSHKPIKKREYLCTEHTYTILILFLYTDQILLSDSLDSLKKNWLCKCYIVACTTWLSVSRRYKRRRVSQAHRYWKISVSKTNFGRETFNICWTVPLQLINN